MKLFVVCVLLIASVGAASAAPPQVQTPMADRGSSPFAIAGRDAPPAVVISPKVRQMQQLRAMALKMQKEDGGTLSAEHHALLQEKLDAINATY